jgi:hypothetical protein
VFIRWIACSLSKVVCGGFFGRSVFRRAHRFADVLVTPNEQNASDKSNDSRSQIKNEAVRHNATRSCLTVG